MCPEQKTRGNPLDNLLTIHFRCFCISILTIVSSDVRWSSVSPKNKLIVDLIWLQNYVSFKNQSTMKEVLQYLCTNTAKLCSTYET